jgi:hypothetical protein
MDGFYIAYLTGSGGSSMVLFAVKEGRLIGADVGGTKYDGRLEKKPGESGFSCHVQYTVPPGTVLITGSGPVATPTNVNLTFDLPENFAEEIVVGIQTPLGPLNATFSKLREFDFCAAVRG